VTCLLHIPQGHSDYSGQDIESVTTLKLARAIRCLRAGLTALFVATQVAGVIPLMHDHTLNVFENAPVAGHLHVKTSIAAPDADHHHGMLDLHDQCCALHALTGPLPQTNDSAPARYAGTRMIPVAAVLVSDGVPPRLDRPPRPLPRI